jgi:hypothetical protein
VRREFGVVELSSGRVQGRWPTLEEAEADVARWYVWKENRRVAAEIEEAEEKRTGGLLGNSERYAWERGPLGDPHPIRNREWQVAVREVGDWEYLTKAER